MRRVLLDTGPLVAFLNRRERHHSWAVAALGAHKPPLLTCEAVLSEAVFLLKRIPGAAAAALEMVERGLVSPVFRLDAEVNATRALLARYERAGMELADACLVRLAELHADCVLMTLDSEFRDVYRRHGRQAIPVELPSDRARARPRRNP